MAEAIDDVGELRGDRRVDMDVDAAGEVDSRRDRAREFVEHDVLVLGLGAELGGLEQPLAVPLIVGDGAPGVRTTPGSTQSLAKEMSPSSRFCWTVALICASRRSCSEWNSSWMAVRPMFSFTRPSPAT